MTGYLRNRRVPGATNIVRDHRIANRYVTRLIIADEKDRTPEGAHLIILHQATA